MRCASSGAAQAQGRTGELRTALAGAALSVASGAAMAAGFAVTPHTASTIGTAGAGAAAAAEDAGTIADNPAGLALLPGAQLIGSGTFVVPGLQFSNAGSTLPLGTPIPGPNGDGGAFAPLPSVFLSAPLNSSLSAGLAVFPRFGLATEYQPGWVGRYQAVSTNLTAIDFAPTLAYRLLPTLSVGISPVARYSKIEFTNAIDFGSIAAGFGVPGAVPAGNDGGIKIKASDWSFAVNGGVLFEPWPETRVGLSYFYNQAARLNGSAKFARPLLGDLVAAATGAFVDTNVSGRLAYPDELDLGVVQRLAPQLDLRASLTWTQWSSFREIRILFANPNQPAALTIENWRDTVTAALGATYRIDSALLLRAGLSYDETPVPDAAHRTPRLPDTNRIGIAIGAGYSLGASIGIDFAYEHLFGNRVALDAVSPTAGSLIGNTSLAADFFALQVAIRF